MEKSNESALGGEMQKARSFCFKYWRDTEIAFKLLFLLERQNIHLKLLFETEMEGWRNHDEPLTPGSARRPSTQE